MAYECEISTETGTASTGLVVKIGVQHYADAVGASIAAFGLSLTLVSAGVGSSLLDGLPASVLTSIGYGSSQVVTARSGVSIESSAGRGASYSKSVLSLQITEAAVASSQAPTAAAGLLSSAAVGESYSTQKTTGLSLVVERGRAASLLPNQSTLTVLSEAIGASYVESRLTGHNDALSAGTADSFAPFMLRSGEDCAASGRASSMLAAKLTANSLVTEWATGWSDYAFAGDGTSYTCRVETFGMSMLSGPRIGSVAEIDGVLYGAGDGGLYVMDGAPGAAIVQTGLADLGTQKRVTYCYVGYTGPDGLTLDVGSTGTGVEETYSYEIEPRIADAATAGRAKLGRGLRTRYLRLTVANKADQPFQLHDMKLVTEQTSRRV